MTHRKWVHSVFFYTIMSVGIALLAIMAISDARASERDDPPPVEVDQDQYQDQAQRQGQAQGQHQGQNASGEGYASADSTGQATNEGNNNVTNAKTTFFSFNRSMPAAGKCFGTVDGGGGSDGGAGFLGINYLNKNCWYAALAGEETNVEAKARLKCGSKHVRNAIAYDSPKKQRQRDCITFYRDTYIAQLTFERKQLDDALAAQTLIIQDYVTTATERTTDTLTRVVETCSDCYGEKSK